MDEEEPLVLAVVRVGRGVVEVELEWLRIHQSYRGEEGNTSIHINTQTYWEVYDTNQRWCGFKHGVLSAL